MSCRRNPSRPLPLPSEPGPSRARAVIVDRLKVPAAKGEYVLRWRWDVEQNSQIWSHCSDVVIV